MATRLIITVLFTGLLLGGFVAAQDMAPSPHGGMHMQDGEQINMQHGTAWAGHEGRGATDILQGLELGTSLTLTFYDGDPENDATVLNTLTFTYGEDSEVAFLRQLEEAKANAAYLTIDTSEQTRTVDLANFDESQRQSLRPRELGFIASLNDATKLTTTFYDGDPEAGGKVLTTLTFTYGSSSEAGFVNEFAQAATTAAFVTIMTSPQTQTINLAASNNDDARGGAHDHSNQSQNNGFGHGENRSPQTLGNNEAGGQGFGHGNEFERSEVTGNVAGENEFGDGEYHNSPMAGGHEEGSQGFSHEGFSHGFSHAN
jgi:hypothetical protein